MDFREHSVEDLAARVRRKEISARELVDASLDRIATLNDQLGAFVAVDPDAARRDATVVDERLAAGDEVGPLAGIPVGVKDLEDAAGFVTTHGSVLSLDDAPSAVDSEFVARLKAAGCVVVGKTNTPELGCKADTTNKAFAPTRNPWDLTRSAGGSSGGSASAVAAGLVPFATASDGGGSIRIPAAICGLTGFKSSLGRIPFAEATPPAWADLSVKGPMARRARDIALILDATVGPDPRDLRSLPMPDNPWRPQLDDAGPPLKVAWSPTLGYAPVDSAVLRVCQDAVDRLAATGCEVIEEPSVFPQDPILSWFAITAASHLRTVGDLMGTPDFDELDPDIKFGVAYARDTLSITELVEANDACHSLNQTLTTLLSDKSFLLCPTVAGRVPEPWGLGTIDGQTDQNWVRFTYPFNLTRSPAGTVFVGRTDDGLPVGLQVIGSHHADAAVLRMLAFLELAIGSDDRAPVG